MKNKALIERVIAKAWVVQKQAYAPYSKFMVGAALLTKPGNLYVGCNVESADYDGTHAEESALAAMVAAGERSPIIVVAVGALEGQKADVVLPCGKCRQKLMEFSSLSGHDLKVIVDLKNRTVPSMQKLSKLLPSSFGPADIGVDLSKYRR